MSTATPSLHVLGEDLLKAAEVATFLGINPATVYRLAGRPHGIPCIQFGGCIRFRPEDVRAYVEEHLVADHGPSRADRLLQAAQVAERAPAYGKPRSRSGSGKRSR